MNVHIDVMRGIRGIRGLRRNMTEAIVISFRNINKNILMHVSGRTSNYIRTVTATVVCLL